MRPTTTTKTYPRPIGLLCVALTITATGGGLGLMGCETSDTSSTPASAHTTPKSPQADLSALPQDAGSAEPPDDADAPATD